jgi:hypothetical protein
VVLLKMVANGKQSVPINTLASPVSVSLSEVSESLNRSEIAGLADYDRKRVKTQNLLEFLVHGIKYVFPQRFGSMTRGLPTAHSHQFMAEQFAGEIPIVWPDAQGEAEGQELLPFYPKQVEAARRDEQLYKLLALVDVIPVGKVREINVAVNELKKRIEDGEPV